LISITAILKISGCLGGLMGGAFTWVWNVLRAVLPNPSWVKSKTEFDTWCCFPG